jgi:hypothetical protein
MKHLILSILVVLIVWSALGLITEDMDFDRMGILIVGIICGFILRKVSEPNSK